MNASINVAGIIASRSSHHTIRFPLGTNKYLDIPIGQIIRCEAQEEITLFHLDGQPHKEIKIFRAIKKCEEDLSKYAFFRVHRKFLVNLSYIHTLDLKSHINKVILVDGQEIHLARRRRKKFLAYLEELRYLPLIGRR